MHCFALGELHHGSIPFPHLEHGILLAGQPPQNGRNVVYSHSGQHALTDQFYDGLHLVESFHQLFLLREA